MRSTAQDCAHCYPCEDILAEKAGHAQCGKGNGIVQQNLHGMHEIRVGNHLQYAEQSASHQSYSAAPPESQEKNGKHINANRASLRQPDQADHGQS